MASIEPSKPSLNPGRWHRPYSWITASAVIQLVLSTLVIAGYISWLNYVNADPPSASSGFAALAFLGNLFVFTPAVLASFMAIIGSAILLIITNDRKKRIQKVGLYLSLIGLGILILGFFAFSLIYTLVLDIMRVLQLEKTVWPSLGLVSASIVILYLLGTGSALVMLIKGWRTVKWSS